MVDTLKLECDICGHETPHSSCGSATQTETIEGDDEEGTPPIDIQWAYHFMQCSVCDGVSIHVDSDFDSGDLFRIYPKKKDLSAVPEKIKEAYQEAKKVKSASATAFAVMIRRALESICIDQKATGGNLKKQLDDLGQKGIIPTTLSKMSHVLRDMGNTGAHVAAGKVSEHEAGVMEDFLLAVIEYVYIAPAKLTQIELSKNKP